VREQVKASKQARPRKKELRLKTYRGCREKQLPYGYDVCHRNYCRIYYNLYDFEYTYRMLWSFFELLIATTTIPGPRFITKNPV
jgi:hypothetical protein